MGDHTLIDAVEDDVTLFDLRRLYGLHRDYFSVPYGGTHTPPGGAKAHAEAAGKEVSAQLKKLLGGEDGGVSEGGGLGAGD